MKILSILLSSRNHISKEKYYRRIILLLIIFSVVRVVGQNKLAYNYIAVLHLTYQETATFWNTPDIEDKKVADSLLSLSDSYIKKGDFSNALLEAERALGIYKKLNETKFVGNSHNKIATIFYFQGNYKEALQNYDYGIAAYEKVKHINGIASSMNNKGAIYYYLGNYPKALDHYKQAVALDKILDNDAYAASTIQNIGGIYSELDDYKNAMKYYDIAKKAYILISDDSALSHIQNAIGEIYSKQGNFKTAITQYNIALALATKTENKQRILESLYKLGEVYNLIGEYQKSLSYYHKALQLAKDIENALYKSTTLTAIGSIENRLGKNQLALSNCKEGLKLAKELNVIPAQKEACTCLYKIYKAINKNKTALAFYEKTIRFKDSLQTMKTSDKLQSMEFEKELLLDSITHAEKERKLQKKHNEEVAEKERQRNILVVSGGLSILFALGLWSRLNFTKKAKASLQVEKDRSEHLLLNILPEEIAEELKEKGYVDAQDFDTASILFTDFKSFTETASKLTPQELVEEINVCFKAFDGIMETYGIEKIKTIGDAYMAAGGLPKPDADAVKNTILAALEMQEFISKRKFDNDNQNIPAFEMRVGIHVGPIVAGIVGVKKFQYDIWGDTVNTASRMESNGAVGKVNISEYTYSLIKDEADLYFKQRETISVKGKGEMAMYFVSKKLKSNTTYPQALSQYPKAAY